MRSTEVINSSDQHFLLQTGNQFDFGTSDYEFGSDDWE
jgi:hypothetical protein